MRSSRPHLERGHQGQVLAAVGAAAVGPPSFDLHVAQDEDGFMLAESCARHRPAVGG
jgi:hypothetical protein